MASNGIALSMIDNNSLFVFFGFSEFTEADNYLPRRHLDICSGKGKYPESFGAWIWGCSINSVSTNFCQGQASGSDEPSQVVTEGEISPDSHVIAYTVQFSCSGLVRHG